MRCIHSISDRFVRFYTLNAGGEGMNVVVRRDGGEFHVLGGGWGNETTEYEFERGVQVIPGFHVYQANIAAMLREGLRRGSCSESLASLVAFSDPLCI
jgi:hypothetical protein